MVASMIVYFHPSFGDMIQFDEHIFRHVWKPPTTFAEPDKKTVHVNCLSWGTLVPLVVCPPRRALAQIWPLRRFMVPWSKVMIERWRFLKIQWVCNRNLNKPAISDLRQPSSSFLDICWLWELCFLNCLNHISTARKVRNIFIRHTPLNVKISSPRKCEKSTAQNWNFSMFPCFFFGFKTTKSKIIHHPSCWDGTIFFVLKQVWIKNGFHPIFQIFRRWENPPRICQVTWRARPYPLVVGSCTLAALIGGCGFAGCDFVSIYRHTAPVYTILAWWKCS